jgi:hypothetical protein
MSIERLSGGLTPADGADPRTFPAIWNATADDLEAGDFSRVPTGGSAGQVLVKDSATDYDASWVGLPNTVDPRAIVTGSGWSRNYISPNGGLTTRTDTSNRLMRIWPWPLFGTQTFTHIGINVTATTVNAGTVSRLGILKANPADFRTFDVVLDAGTVAIDTTGIKEISINQTLTPGVYWLGSMIEGLTSGSVTFTAVSGSSLFMPVGFAVSGSSLNAAAGTGSTQPADGPWPSTISGFASVSSPVYTFLRY